MFATGAQAQVECTGNGPYTVPSNWALKPSGLAAGTNFRLLFVTSTTRNAGATGIATYNTFVQTRAKAGHSAITDSCGNRFKVVGSTSAVDARDNTATTGTGEAIYWLTGNKVADNYADFYDGSWDDRTVKSESGTTLTSSNIDRIWTGSNNDGTKRTGLWLGAALSVRHAQTSGATLSSAHAAGVNSGNFYALSPIFTVGAEPPTLSLSLASTSGAEGNSGNDDVTVTISLSPTRSESTTFNFCVKSTGTATFRTASGGKARDFNIVNFFGGSNLSMNAQNCHSYTINANAGSSQVKLRIFGDTTPEANETAVLELRNPPSGVAVSSTAGTATYTINNDDGSRPTLTISGGSAVTEGTGAEFTVNANTAPSVALTVQLDVSDDDTSDFVASGNEGRKTVTIAANATSTTYTVATEADSTDEPNGEVTVEVLAADGYAVGSTSSATVTVNDDDDSGADTTAPRVTSIARQSPTSQLTNADTLTWRVTFNEAVQNVNAVDFLPSPGSTIPFPLTTLAVTQVGATNAYDVTASGTGVQGANGPIYLRFASAQDIEDTAGNALANTTPTGTNDNSFILDNEKPRVESITRQSPTVSPTDADSLTWRVTFQEKVVNVNAADFQVSGTTATVTGVSQVGSTNAWDVTVSGGNLASLNGTVTLSLASDQDIEDEAGNALPNFTPEFAANANHNSFVVSNTAANNAPTVANQIPNQTATTGTAFSYQFPTNTFADADNDGLTYTATKSDGTNLPSWLTFTPGTRTFSGTPGSGDTGTLSVKVTASDGNGGTVSDTFDITVSTASTSNIKVTVEAVTANVKAGKLVTFAVKATPAPRDNLTVNVTIADSNSVIRGNRARNLRTHVIPGYGNDPHPPLFESHGISFWTYPNKSGNVTMTLGNGAYRKGNTSATAKVTAPPTLSLGLASASGNEGASGSSSYVNVNLKLSPTRSVATKFKLCVKDTGTATFRTDSGSDVRDFDVVHANSNTQLSMTANCHDYTIGAGSGSSRVRLRIFGDATVEGDETAILELRDAPDGVKLSPARAAYTITNDDTAPAPAKPVGFTATAGDTEVALSWTDPGNSTITAWQYRQKAGSGSYGSWTDIPGSTASTTSHTVTNLTNGTAYTFRIRARAGTTDGTASDARSATPTAGTPGLVMSTSALTVNEGATGSYTVKLASRPTGTVTVHIASDNPDVTVSPAPLTFHRSGGAKLWSTAQALTVSAGHDNDAVDDSATLTHTASGGGYGAVGATVGVTVDDDETPATPTLSVAIAPASADEGAAGSQRYATVTLRLDPVRGAATSFKACLENTGTATRGSAADYRFVHLANDTPLSLANACYTATIPAHQASRQVRLLIRGDAAVEPDETVVVELRDAPQGVNISGTTGSATYTIVNDDTATDTCVSDALVETVEGYYDNRGSGLGAGWFRVLVAFGERNANDWTGDGRTITPMPASVAREQAALWHGWGPVADALECLEGTTTRTDPAVTVTGGSTVTEGGHAVFTVSATPTPTSSLTVTLTVADDATSDFLSAGDEGTRTVTLSGGQSATTLTVATQDDGADEPDGSVTATVAAGNGYRVGSPAAGTVAVNDNDATPQATPVVSIAAGDAIAEGGTARFTLTASPVPQGSITVRVQVTQSGAFAGSGQLGTRSVAMGTDGTATLTVATVNDSTVETDGSLTATVWTGTGYTPHGTQVSAAVAVSDNDTPPVVPPVVSIEAGDNIAEGATAQFTLTATPAPASALTVEVQVRQSGAFAGSGQLGTRTVTVGTDGTAVLTVSTVNDDTVETDGALTAAVRTGTGYRVAAAPDDAASVRVADNDIADGTPTLSVADATASESSRACAGGHVSCMRFTVTLSHMPADQPHGVGFLYYTRELTPVSARGKSYPRDYYHRMGTARFWPGGALTQTVTVRLADDGIDEGPETFELVIDYPDGAAITDGVAVGTITNSDPMPKAWLARFGRTVAEQALDGISNRMAAPRTAGVEGAFAGLALGAAHAPAASRGLSDYPPPAQPDVGHGGVGEAPPQTLTLHEALLGSHFTATGATDASGGSLAVWGRAAHSTFDGREGTFSLDGETTTALLGADYARGDWLLGLALTQSEGDGAYRDIHTTPRPDTQDCTGMDETLCTGAVREGDGDVEASLTSAMPYAALEASERLKLWGALGVGAGEVTLKPTMGGTLESDLSWTMAAAGARSELLSPQNEEAGLALALVSDALWARTNSDKTRDLAASDSDVTRLRLGLEGRWMNPLEGGGHFTPKLEAGMRHDGGDAETGFGIELGGGLAWSDPTLGLNLDLSGRTLLAHGDDDLKDRGFAASFTFDPDPASERGASFTLRQDWGGQTEGGLDALFGADPLEDRTGGGETHSRWTMEAAYGLPAFGGRFTGSPHAGIGLSTGARDYTLGWRLTPATGAHVLDVSFGAKATRRESEGDAPEHTVGVELGARW